MKTIIEMAEEAGFAFEEQDNLFVVDPDGVCKFAELVRADEREALKAEIERLKADSDRLAYVYSNAKTDSDALVKLEFRLINDDVPTIEEVRIAIDTAIQAGGNA